MIISVASGKGGTGKTLVATSLALSLKERDNVQLLDCDVEEPNDHIFMKPAISRSEAVSIPVPKVDEEKCTCFCINKYDLNEDNTWQIGNYCLKQGIEVATRILFGNAVTESNICGLPVVEYSQGKVTHEIKSLWWHISRVIYLT